MNLRFQLLLLKIIFGFGRSLVQWGTLFIEEALVQRKRLASKKRRFRVGADTHKQRSLVNERYQPKTPPYLMLLTASRPLMIRNEHRSQRQRTEVQNKERIHSMANNHCPWLVTEERSWACPSGKVRSGIHWEVTKQYYTLKWSKLGRLLVRSSVHRACPLNIALLE